MKKIWILCFILLISVGLNGQDTSLNSIAGSWMGRLEVSSISLRIIFNISVINKDSLGVTLDSPDQGVKNIKIGPVTFDGKTVKIMAPLLLGEYNGRLTNDTLIAGTWKQSGRTFDLNLTRLRTAFKLIRPQEPKPPFPYASEDVTFMNEKAGIRLAGTLTIPSGKGPFPAVVMISGSGPQNRNEEIMGHKPFLVIADYFARHGIAVLRYDDRGVGQSQGLRSNATSKDLASDAMSAFDFLKTQKSIDQRKIGLAGHSEGGFIAPIVAISRPDVAFIISLAGPGVKGEKILFRQTKDLILASGGTEKQVKDALSSNARIYSVLKKETDNVKAEEKIREVYKKILIKEKLDTGEIKTRMDQLNASMSPSSYDWLRYFITTNPATFWKKVHCPVLALNGEKDVQVNADINLNAIEKALKSGGNNSFKIIKLPGLNHLFQHCDTGLPAEYGEIEETISPDVLRIMSGWILDLR